MGTTSLIIFSLGTVYHRTIWCVESHRESIQAFKAKVICIQPCLAENHFFPAGLTREKYVMFGTHGGLFTARWCTLAAASLDTLRRGGSWRNDQNRFTSSMWSWTHRMDIIQMDKCSWFIDQHLFDEVWWIFGFDSYGYIYRYLLQISYQLHR